MELELRHARIVVTISTTGSISAGAQELGLPQPSLTAQLRRIERAVGGDLFVRSRSGVTPTELGARLVPRLADLVRRADEVMAEAQAAAGGPLQLGNTEWTPPTLRDALQAALPGTPVQTRTLPPQAAVEAVQRGSLTAALVPRVPGPGGPGSGESDTGEPALGRALVVREPVWLAVPRGHRLAGRELLRADELAEVTEDHGLPWVRSSGDHWFHSVERRVLGAAAPARVLHQVNSHQEAMNWVRDTGVAALTTPSGAVPEVTLVPVAGTQRVEMVLLWRGSAVSRETLHTLVDTVRAYYCGYARSRPGYWAWMQRHPDEFRELHRYLPEPVGA
ncbi:MULTISPECIES: LysR family transcriptional regulator [unclassified Streptomyces]|uniref:LysR family transcriptional regulator n=1 Tax=unclassified Streptomyces TaxID=2593676 RepID=UPI001BEB218E|nr:MULTISPECIES: LysR family transcriptional regulator [unclassified Streptomyces]MBT2405490.1 LysR family transcriptional regulator [Streptomyces sp. ISL-21]MBT2607831.1 LysR family transcriptional regulator [Streptomyces sp. ISL-87]